MNNNASTTTTTANPIYVTFKDSGVTGSLVALIGCKSFVCLVGVLLNLDLVYVTVKTKTLRGTCNVQIALNALSIAVQECSAFVTFAIVTSGVNFIPLHICGIIQFVPLFCTIFTNGIAFSIGIDRLFSVLCPLWYITRDKKRTYLYTIIVICSLYASIVPIVSLKISLQNPMIPVMCTVIDPAQKEATWVVIMLLVVNCFSVCCYIVVWLLVIFSKNMVQKQVNIFKSLSMILLLELFGWVTNYSIRLIIGASDIHALQIWFIVNISTIAPYVSMSVSPIVLYAFSSDYRRAFFMQLPPKFREKISSEKTTLQIRRPVTELNKINIYSKIRQENTHQLYL